MRLEDIPMQRKLIGGFLLVGSLPVILLAVVSLWVSISALSGQTSDQLTAIREMKRQQLESYFVQRKNDLDVLGKTVESFRREASNKLTAIRDAKQAYLNYYLSTIRGQTLTFAESQMVVEAMRSLPSHFENYRNERSLSTAAVDALRPQLKTYWDQEFSEQYQQLNAGAQPDLSSRFRMLDTDSIALQYQFIRNNPNPLGAKDELDRPAGDNTAYGRLHSQIHPVIRSYLRQFGYYDIFLVDSQSGDIVYSVFKELDYSTSLNSGPFAKTNLGRVFQRANAATEPGSFFIEDFEPYWPSYEAPAAFVASPIFDGRRKLGVAIFQFPIDTLNAVMTDRSGLGETGETYLVGKDLQMRSDSFLDPENFSLVNSFRRKDQGRVQTTAVSAALEGNSGVGVLQNYLGHYVLSAWAPFRFENLEWAILSEMDVREVLNPLDGSGEEFYASFQKLYGYYDLFLIDPDGEIFYTVAREADYQTNILTGPYANSNLGQAVRTALRTGHLSFADFEPYAPSNDAPAAFIAEPVQQNGQTQVIVALQLSDSDLNTVMSQRAGMGETGETYLVGSDFRLRSSTRDPARTLESSFAGTVAANGAETETVRAALNGEKDTAIHENYNDNTVLASYSPLEIFDRSWALVAELELSETMQPIWLLLSIVLLLLVASMAVIFRLAQMLAKSITVPVDEAVHALQAISDHQDLTVAINVHQHDEIGQMAEAMRRMVHNLNGALQQVGMASCQVQQESGTLEGASTQLAEKASSQAAALEQISSSAAELAAQTGGNREMASKASEVSHQMRDNARLGGERMKRFAGTMDEIQSSTQNITQITVVISEIAAQTRMLAINASIEAARAGAHGAGFAVVAQEVQQLAAQTAESAEQITHLINKSVQKVEGGRQMMQEAQRSLEQIFASAETTAEMMHALRQAADEQAEGIQQVNQALEELNQLTMSNAQLSETNAKSSEQLAAQAEELQRVVATFQLLEALPPRATAALPAPTYPPH